MDKGKAIERWRRKVTGLGGASPTVAGPLSSVAVNGQFRPVSSGEHGWLAIFMAQTPDNARTASRAAMVQLCERACRILVLPALAWLALGAPVAHAQATDCSSFPNATLDGFVTPNPPSQISIDTNCTIRNFPASNPLTTNFSFFTQPGQNQERWLIIFDNVVHTGQMSCNAVLEHKIWFTNGSSSTIQQGCQNLLIPVEKIDKQNPPGQTTAAIGVPFTYTLTSPVLFDPATGNVINTAGSVNDLHGITIVDDLNATGVSLTYLGHTAYWKSSGAPIPYTFSNVGGVLTFDQFPVVPAGEQFIIEITVVLNDAPLINTIGKQFVNTAKWDFGRLIEGIFYEPLPGEWGISEPLTIAGPDLVVTKTGPATIGRTLNLGEWGDFGIDVHNTGLSDAWDVTILDRLPNDATGGMCDTTPEVLNARVFAADGVTTIPGKGPLTQGVDFTFSYSGLPSCEMTLNMLSAAAAIGPDERLIIDYRTRLDADSVDGATLTNVVGATRWYNGDSSNLDRQSYVRTITNGTPGVPDHEDAHTTVVELRGYFFEKTVANLTTGVSPTTTAAPGDTLRYTLRLQTTDGALSNFSFYDDLGAMNGIPVFVPGSLTLVAGTIPGGADTSNTDPNGGTNSAGILDIRNLSLPVASEVSIQFDITLRANLSDGTQVTNQADLINVIKIADSDDPYVNGQADPNVPGDEDPTSIIIEGPPPMALLKANTQATATIGEEFSYTITVPSTPHTSPLYDVRILDDLFTSAADLEFVSVAKVSPGGGWNPINTGTATSLIIEGTGNGIDIPIGAQVTLQLTVRLRDTAANIAGLAFTNTAAYTYNLRNNDPSSERPGAAGTTAPMTVVEPELTLEKDGPLQMRVGQPGTFTLDVHNIGTSPAYNTYITDVLPKTATGGMCDLAPAQVTAQLFAADGITPVAAALVAGTDFVATFNGDPVCTFTLEMLTPTAAIGVDERLIISYEASLDANTQQDAVLTNIAGATEWFSLSQSPVNDYARDYTRALTDGTVGVLDHEDAHTLVEFSPVLLFEKTVANVTSGADPASTATPGDTLRYSLRVENFSATAVTNFGIVDELDSLNAIPGFQAGTLNIVTLPNGADSSNTDVNGGAAGTGLLDVRGLSLAGLGDSVLIEFEVQLAPVIANDTVIYNQSQLIYTGLPIALSDDPNVNGASDPNIDGDEDPTQIRIQSAPAFDIDKISSYITGDPSVLLAGETLRYTITVQNIGTDNATNVDITDQVPANTSYVAGSTTLNGVAVPDAGAGVSPLVNGILINAPQDPTPGVMNAGVPNNVATIVFDVVVYPDVPDGTVISNQAFVSAVDYGIADVPSDDPRTPLVDDPTRDVVGNYPLLFAPKSAALQVDLGSPGIVDPGDVLRYTITVYNNGTVPATAADLTDVVPANTTYVADSTTLNGLPVGQPDGGLFPLIAGIPISSADLTPPVPAAGAGIVNPGQSAVVQFDLQVDAAAVPGTLIVNQATVYTLEVPTTLTDGDGNPATGPEPTVVVVGDVQQLSIIKEVSVVNGGPALAGAELEYVVTVRNIGAVPAYFVTIMDDLDVPNPGYLAYVLGSATMNGLPDGVTVAGSLITADYFNEYGTLDPGASVVLRFRAVINPNLLEGTTITNTALVYWDDPQRQLDASVSIDVGAMPNAGMLSGYVWHDADHDDTPDTVERPLEGWTVTLVLNNQPLRSMLTDVDGFYRFSNVTPNYTAGETYSLVFSAPGAVATTALLGTTDSDFTDGLQRIDEIDVQEGSNLLALNMPVDPNGVIYDSVVRAPIAGATATLVDVRNGLAVSEDCFDDPNQQDQVTIGNGYYKFDLNFADASCQPGPYYVIRVTAPNSSYIAGVSEIIPPSSDATTAPFDVPACPGSANDAVLATSQYCEAQLSEFQPGTSVPAQSAATRYHLFLDLDDSQQPGSAQLFNNHIPLDPRLDGAISVSKTTPMLNVSRGQLVPYVITVSNSFGADLTGVTVIDRFPAGFRYIKDSARFDDVANEPTVVGRELQWSDLTLNVDGRHTIKLLLAVGAGVTEGEFVNRALAVNSVTGSAMSAEAEAMVRLVPDPTFDCTDVTGKVFDDTNRNGYQDGDETGLAGVRLVTPSGLAATTDPNGRYHITCAITPNESRGSNFVLKLDDRTLPSGFRMSTRPVQVQRATRGKALRINFGASIHRVVGLDVADAVFEPGTVEIRQQWLPRFNMLLEELQKGPAVLRLSYVADVEEASLVEQRLDSVQKRIEGEWEALDCCYKLTIEPEIFWRLGAPPEQPRERRQ